MSLYPITLDTIAAIQHVPKFNQIASAMGAAALFGVQSYENLTLTLYGGTFVSTGGTPFTLDAQTVELDSSTTNYIYSDTSGVVVNTTIIPASWPGPLPSGGIALYELDTNADEITDGTCYLLSRGGVGRDGPQGATGATGAALWFQRPRVWHIVGADATNSYQHGFAITSSGHSARSLGTTLFRETVPYATMVGTGSGSAGRSGNVYHTQHLFHLGNAAGRGGFKVSFRICRDTTFTAADERSFIGLYNLAPGVPGNADPSTLINMIGFAADHGDANYSIMHNDASGTASKTTLGANFPARATDNVYEMTFESEANSGIVDYSILDAGTGNTASGTISSDLPSNTTFLTWLAWINNGSNTTNCVINGMQVIANTRY